MDGLILVVLACFIAWKVIRGEFRKRFIRIVVIGIIVTGIVALSAGSIPVVEVPTGENQELRVMPPTAFPFTLQQYRDYDTNQFYYRIVIGWPDGVPIHEGVATDDQSEFIHLAHFGADVILGTYLLSGTIVILALIYLLERRNRQENIY